MLPTTGTELQSSPGAVPVSAATSLRRQDTNRAQPELPLSSERMRDAGILAALTRIADSQQSVLSQQSEMQEQQKLIAAGVAALERRMAVVEGRVDREGSSSTAQPPLLSLPAQSDATTVKPLLLTQQDIAVMKLLASHTRAVVPTIRWFCFATVLSFVNEVPACRTWIPESTHERFTALTSLLPGVSGLALVFFSVRNNEKKTEGYNRRDGAVWTHILRWIFAHMITSGRSEIYKDAPHVEPPWLSRFGDASRTLDIVQTRLKKFRSFADVDEDDTPLPSPPAKRRRKADDLSSLPYGGVDVQQRVLARIKTSVLRFLTYNRRCAKLFLFRELLFLVEKIKTIGNAETAEEKGFYFHLLDPDPEEIVAENIEGTRWDIPLAHRDDVQDAVSSADGLNDNLLLELQGRFPSLRVEAHWRKTVQFCANDSRQDHEDYRRPGLSLPFSKTISLLSVAQGVLRDFVRKSAAQNVMRSSRYSLLTVHIFAVGLRGIVADCMNLPLSHTERVAMGSVRALPRVKNQDFVSLFVSGSTVPTTDSLSRESSAAMPSSAIFGDTIPSASQQSGTHAPSTMDTPSTGTGHPRSSLRSGDKDSEELNSERNRLLTMSWSEYLQIKDNLSSAIATQGQDPLAMLPTDSYRESSENGALLNLNVDVEDVQHMLDDIS